MAAPGGGGSWWWQGANMMSTVAALASLDPGVANNVAWIWGNTFNLGGHQPHAKRGEKFMTKRQQTGDNGFLGGYYDDEAWWAVAWLDIEELTGDLTYLNEAIYIWDDMKAAWGTQVCGALPWKRGEPTSSSPQAISNGKQHQPAHIIHH